VENSELLFRHGTRDAIITAFHHHEALMWRLCEDRLVVGIVNVGKVLTGIYPRSY
jgi:hypothetical protein